ncbi:hypothetical protein M2360_000054 [Rhizobium sp. SG_E_25_P2]|uniref:DUF6030 family protein n=1 Tax=Rhizobium sp. SG_E_25_P2 TaxID=2879942 RepID=UPI0024753CBB|nr:DUF6030 family protein [Rhizobium sp. SG_E_25_P2]MDH6264673.1 hypothetical protein [Rhizobium sp. SG_E_25_P2]
MEKSPIRRRGTLFFWLAFAVIAGAIGATVLLARDGANLKQIIAALGLSPVPQQIAAGTSATKTKRLRNLSIPLDPIVFRREIKDAESAFLRRLSIDAKALCESFAEAGFAMSGWAPGVFSSKTYECWGEQIFNATAEPDKQSSFFLMVKGLPDGDLLSARVKFIFTSPEMRDRLTNDAVRMLTLLAEKTRWGDLADHAADIRALKPFTLDAFGLRVKFSNEFSGLGRYNLVVSRDGSLTDAEKRTRAYFNRAAYLPLPPDMAEKKPAAAHDAKKQDESND